MPLSRPPFGTSLRRDYSRHPAKCPPHTRRQLSTTPLHQLQSVPGLRTILQARLETILFLSPEPVPAQRLADIVHLSNISELRDQIEQLRKQLQADDSAFTLDKVAGGYQLRTGPATTPWLIRLKRMPAYHGLPPNLLETLTVIAYKQPVTRADVEAVRGGACAEAIKILLGKGLVRTAGRHASLGRPQLYATTNRFLQIFGLNSLAELPANP